MKRLIIKLLFNQSDRFWIREAIIDSRERKQKVLNDTIREEVAPRLYDLQKLFDTYQNDQYQ